MVSIVVAAFAASGSDVSLLQEENTVTAKASVMNCLNIMKDLIPAI
jgi:hypothetical protein